MAAWAHRHWSSPVSGSHFVQVSMSLSAVATHESWRCSTGRMETVPPRTRCGWCFPPHPYSRAAPPQPHRAAAEEPQGRTSRPTLGDDRSSETSSPESCPHIAPKAPPVQFKPLEDLHYQGNRTKQKHTTTICARHGIPLAAPGHLQPPCARGAAACMPVSPGTDGSSDWPDFQKGDSDFHTDVFLDKDLFG